MDNSDAVTVQKCREARYQCLMLLHISNYLVPTAFPFLRSQVKEHCLRIGPTEMAMAISRTVQCWRWTEVVTGETSHAKAFFSVLRNMDTYANII